MYNAVDCISTFNILSINIRIFLSALIWVDAEFRANHFLWSYKLYPCLLYLWVHPQLYLQINQLTPSSERPTSNFRLTIKQWHAIFLTPCTFVIATIYYENHTLVDIRQHFLYYFTFPIYILGWHIFFCLFSISFYLRCYKSYRYSATRTSAFSAINRGGVVVLFTGDVSELSNYNTFAKDSVRSNVWHLLKDPCSTYSSFKMSILFLHFNQFNFHYVQFTSLNYW